MGKKKIIAAEEQTDLIEIEKTPAEQFIEMVRVNLTDLRNKFFEIGFRLYDAKENEYYKDLGYESIEELAEAEFDIKRATTFEYIKVFRRFCVTTREGGNALALPSAYNVLNNEYKGYTFWQLSALSKLKYMPDRLKELVPATATVRDIDGWVRYKNKCLGRVSMTLPEWKEQIYLPAQAAKEAKQIEMQEVLPHEVVQTSGYPVGLFANQAAKEKFEKRFREYFKYYAFRFCPPDRLKTVSNTIELTLDEVLLDIFKCAEIYK